MADTLLGTNVLHRQAIGHWNFYPSDTLIAHALPVCHLLRQLLRRPFEAYSTSIRRYYSHMLVQTLVTKFGNFSISPKYLYYSIALPNQYSQTLKPRNRSYRTIL